MKDVPGYQSDWEWWEDFVNWITGYAVDIFFFILIAFFFAPISTIFVSIYLDDIVDCVEGRFYPENKADKRLGVPKLAFLATRISFFCRYSQYFGHSAIHFVLLDSVRTAWHFLFIKWLFTWLGLL